MIARPEFGRAIVAYGLAMGALVIQQVTALARRPGPLRGRSPSAGWILAGVAVAAAGSAVQRSGLSIHPHWFDHNALYHVVQMAAAGLLYRGGLQLEDRG
ncbi:MAG TPA: hypothetical protein VM778_01800 [Gemmatimonadota bacterium]|nr:hypothetical protein [Gemmatimonadota bacterium]